MAAAAIILAAPIASAHEFVCEKTVDGQDIVHVDTYPTTVTYEWTITNALPSESSTTSKVADSIFFPLLEGGAVSPDVPFTLPLTLPGGASTSETQTLTIDSYEDCADLATIEPNGDITLTNTLTVYFDSTSTTCDAQVVCHPPGEENGEGCLTRTPGYWGTHPLITAEFLPVESCGEELTTTQAATSGSITEDLCSVGKDHEAYGSPQEAQLVRQCAAAALNIAASDSLGGSCEESLSFERFAECCTSCGGSGTDIAASGCIEDLDEFNNTADTLLDDGEEINLCKELGLSCAAQPQQCQAANGNGWVSDREGVVSASTAGASPQAATARPTSGGCSGGPGGVVSLLGALGLLALRRRR